MPKQKLTTIFTVTVEHDKPIPDLVDLVAGRAYTLDGVTNATASLLLSREIGVALEPAVPEAAQALIDRGRASSIYARFADWARGLVPVKRKDPMTLWD